MAGPDVSDLHQDLMRLGYAIDADERREQSFGVATARAVAAFQASRGLPDTAVLDEAAAAALTGAVAESGEQTLLTQPGESGLEPTAAFAPGELGAYTGAEAPQSPWQQAEPPAAAPFTGRVTSIPDFSSDRPAAGPAIPVGLPGGNPVAGSPVAGTPMAGIPITVDSEPVAEPASATDHGTETAAGVAEAVAEGTGPVSQRAAGRLVDGPVGVSIVDDQPDADEADQGMARLAALAGRFLEMGAAKQEPEGYEVAGKVYLRHGAPAAGATIRVYHKGFGDEKTLLGEQTIKADGSYRVAYDPGRFAANLEIQLVTGDGREIALNDTKYQAGKRENLNLVAPPAKLAPEWERIQADVRPYLGESSLGDAQETGDRSDVTLLNRATGWDSRVLALAAAADGLSRETGVDPQALYGAMRSGLPTGRVQLAEVRPSVMEAALKHAVKAGVVDLSEREIAQAGESFRRFTREVRRANIAPGTLSSHGEMMSAARLSERDQDRLDDLLAEPGEGSLWERAAQAELPVERLRVTGKLGYLTGNNAPLAATLAELVQSPEQLGERLSGERLYDPEVWAERLHAAAGRGGVDELIPSSFTGTPEERLGAYTKDLARKVRLSYPTEVATQMVARRELPLDTSVATVLTRAAAKGFTLGRTPVHAFARQHSETLFAGMSSEQIALATSQTATLQRIFQVSPSDHAMRVLLENGYTSAQQITSTTREKFTARLTPQLGSIIADLIWRRAEQISVVVHTFFGSAQQSATQPPVFAVTPSTGDIELAKDNFLKQYPTMESLFGSQDYCECDHCRSVLSPAAYLVDLLKFLDPDENEWTFDLSDWKSKHGGAPYPFPDMATWNAYRNSVDDPLKELTPFEVLSMRRPDIPELQLTCENTNTVLPYIDLTNEILEYWFAHGKLEGAAVHNHTDELTADLLSEPQHLIPSVYDDLAQARYPMTLPFDLWRSTVGEFLGHFEAPLWRLLQAVAGADEDVVLLERLGLPPADQDILTAPNPLSQWHKLYGYPTQNLALAELRNAKKLARRLGVSYKELVTLVKSGFVNPKLDTLVALRRLGVAAEDVMRFKAQPGYAPFSTQEKADFADLIAAQDGTAWLEASWTAGEFGEVLVLADPTGDLGFDNTTLRFADGTPADAEAFVRLNYLTRLWRKLGWGIEETDRALCVFRPAGPLGPSMSAALVGLAKLHALSGYFGTGAAARRKALFLFSDLDDRRYRELFLTRSILSTDPVFDSADGNYLDYTYDPGQPDDPATGNVSLAGHLGAVKAALKLTTEEAEGLVDLSTAPLTIPVLSVLHRWSLLAKALRLPVAELIALRELTGLDPFSESYLKLARDLKPLAVADLDYVVRHRFDPVGPFRSAARPPYAILRVLAAEIGRINTEHADRPLIDSELRSKLTLALPANVAETTMGVLAGTADPVTAKPLLAPHLVELGFLTQAQFDGLFAEPAPGLDPLAAQQFADAKRATLATAFLPYLRVRLIRAAIVETLGDPAGVVLTEPLYDAFAAAGARGFDQSGNNLDGWIQVPVAGTYVFAVNAPSAGTAVSLTLDHVADPVILASTAGAGETVTGEVELTAGTLYRLTLTASQPVILTMSGNGQPAGPVGNVYPHSMVQALWDAHLYVTKVLLVAERLELAPAELAHLLPALSPLTIEAVLATVAYTGLREEIGADPADLVELLTRSRRSFPATIDPTAAQDEVLADLSQRLAAMIRRTPELVLAAIKLNPTPVSSIVDGDRLIVTASGFTTAAELRRIWEVLVLAQRLGAGVDALRRWAVPRPGFEIARDLRDTVKARYEPENWRRVAQPINDRLRKLRRDALVAWILHHHPAGFERVEQLFEYFLIDPGMEPVVQTSRLRLALSSVQTFIQRSLLNLERQVHPSALNAAHWEWMKRYRVWEANRKIFLWPENWLHPEFRDDKSHLFVALESAMMESDLTLDLTERAFYDYLLGLEEIARLDVRSIYLQEMPDPGDNVVHVVARTFGSPHKYFYRTYQHMMWTPWQPISVEIEGDHIAAVVWRGRVHLFWVTFMDRHNRKEENRTPSDMLDAKVSSASVSRIAQVHLHWTELFQGQWTEPSQSSLEYPLEMVVPYYYRYATEMMHITHDTANGADAVLIHLNGAINSSYRLASKLAPAEPYANHQLHPELPYPVVGPWGEWVGIQPLNVTYAEESKTNPSGYGSKRVETRTILAKETGYRLRMPSNRTSRLPASLAGLVSPFFYQHASNTFFVLPELTERTLVEYDDWIAMVPPATEIDPGRLHELDPLIPELVQPDPIGPIARFELETPRDWLTSEATVVHFGDRVFGHSLNDAVRNEGIVR
jgi:peptidoglycan hydrolase-like protein with peptidoglycan-binding domain